MTLRIVWATDYEGIGNAYGFTLGNRLGRQAALDAHIQIVPPRPMGEGPGVRGQGQPALAVHHCPPHSFQPIDGMVNVLWTAWEFPELVPAEVAGLKRAHILFATARFLVDVFEKASGVPTFYVPQGIRTDLFDEFQRRRPNGAQAPACAWHADRPSPVFRYLWVGAPNDRKGWRHILSAWKAFQRDPSCELVLKTTFASDALKSGRFGNVTVDTRRIGDEEMRDLYRSAHCFVFPSMGEGFGFTLGEAMATGLPCVYTPATALADLCDRTCGYPLKHRMMPCFEMEIARGKTRTLMAANPDVTDLANQMRRVRLDYAEALRRGHLAAARIRERFTWRHAGEALRRKLELIQSELPERRIA